MLTSLLSQDKEEKEKLMVSKAAVEESDKEGCNSGGEEIIELQEMRMSPIPSLRNRHKQKYYKDPRGEEFESVFLILIKIFSGSDQSFPPSFRMHRNYSFPVRGGGHSHSRKDKKRTRLLNQLKKSAGVIKSSLPKIKDVNVIDKYSRVVFPVSFILFNVAYWCFYVLDTDGQ